MNIVTLLEMAAEVFPDRIAVTDGARQLTYAGLLQAAQAAGRAIRASGAVHVSLLDIGSLAAPVALYGAAYARVPYAPLNYRLAKAEIEALIARVAPVCLVASPDFADPLALGDGVSLIGRAAFLALDPPAEPLAASDEPRDIAVQLFTSGTTGRPKAAILRHGNLTAYILGTVEFGAADEAEATLVAVPPYHIAGISAVLSSTYAGRRMVLLGNFEPRHWLDLAASERVSHAFLVPTMLARLVEHLAAPPDLPALRAIAYGGGKMPLPVMERAMALFPTVDFTNAYGLTETSSTICLLDPADHRLAAASADPAIRKRLGSVGRPLATVELEIRDEAGAVLPAGEAGYVFVRGEQVSGEYLGAGSLLDAEGWFPTRDRGLLDAGGYLFLDGRADDVIVRGGENISPGEIEAALLAHPAVAEAAVVAIPDEEWGEGVGAAIVLKPGAAATAAELQGWVKARLRSSRVPTVIRFRETLPYNELGKLLRRVVKQEFAG